MTIPCALPYVMPLQLMVFYARTIFTKSILGVKYTLCSKMAKKLSLLRCLMTNSKKWEHPIKEEIPFQVVKCQRKIQA